VQEYVRPVGYIVTLTAAVTARPLFFVPVPHPDTSFVLPFIKPPVQRVIIFNYAEDFAFTQNL
jgi:hypothetical protein